MNHDDQLKPLGDALKTVFNSFIEDISDIENMKIKIDCRQNLEKAQHWAVKMSKLLDDLNVYLSVFGTNGGLK